jgi:hypothetical protein
MKTEGDFNNLADALKKRLKEATDKLSKVEESGLTPEKVSELFREELKNLNPGKDYDPNDAKIHDLERKMADMNDKLKHSAEERDEAIKGRDKLTIKTQLSAGLMETSARTESVETVISFTSDFFELDSNDNVVSKVDCEFGANLPPKDVFEKMKTDTRYAPFWPPSKGSRADGVDGTDNGDDGGKSNPFSDKSWNKTKQYELKTKDTKNAEKLAKDAGFNDLDEAMKSSNPKQAA